MRAGKPGERKGPVRGGQSEFAIEWVVIDGGIMPNEIVTIIVPPGVYRLR